MKNFYTTSSGRLFLKAISLVVSVGISVAFYFISIGLGQRPKEAWTMSCIMSFDLLIFIIVLTTCIAPFISGTVRQDGKPFERKDRILAVIAMIASIPVLAMLGWITYGCFD